MKIIKVLFLLTALVLIFPTFENKAEAGTAVSIGVGYGYHPYYYHPFYRYRYYGFSSPFYYPYGFYRPYPYYGYGYYGGPYYRGYYSRGEVRIEVEPKEAQVYVDGNYVGRVDDFDGWWQRLKLEPGRHRIVIRHQGYQPLTLTMRILAGEDYHIEEVLRPGQDTLQEDDLYLEPDSRYERDRRYEPNRRYEPGRRYPDRDRDRYRDDEYDRERRDGRRYDPYGNEDRRRERAPENEGRDYGYEGDRSSGRQAFTLQVEPPDAAIYIDGEYYGTADAVRSGEVRILLPVGVHRIEITRPGYETYSREIQVDSDEMNNRLVVRLQKK